MLFITYLYLFSLLFTITIKSVLSFLLISIINVHSNLFYFTISASEVFTKYFDCVLMTLKITTSIPTFQNILLCVDIKVN